MSKTETTTTVEQVTAQRVLDAQGAWNIINGFKKIIKPNKEYEDVVVSSISTINGKTGMPFTYKESGEPYAILNLKAVNAYKLNQAVESFRNGDYQEACNNNMTVNIPLSQVGTIGYAGTLVTEQVPVKDKETRELTGELALVGKKFIPNAKIVGENVDLSVLLGMEKPTGNKLGAKLAKAKGVPNEDDA